MLNRSVSRGLLTSALVALALSACSFSYSSSSGRSAAPNQPSSSSSGKAVHHHNAPTKIDDRTKAINGGGGSGTKPIKHVDTGDTGPTKANPGTGPTREPSPAPSGPVRTQAGPKRIKPAPSRTPPTTEPAEVQPANAPTAGNNTIRAKSKTTNPSASDTLVAPQ